MQNTFRTFALKTGNKIEFLISKSRSFHKLTVEGKNEFLNFSLLHIKELMFCPDLKGIYARSSTKSGKRSTRYTGASLLTEVSRTLR